MGIKHLGFQNLLYSKFVSPGEHDAKAVAQALGESLSSFYNYVEGVTYCPVDLVARLYKVTGDMDFLNFIISGTDMMLAPRQKATIDKGILEEALDVASASGKVVARVHSALEDGVIGAAERRRIMREIDAAQKELEDARLAVMGANGEWR